MELTDFNGAQGRTRTGTTLSGQRILSAMPNCIFPAFLGKSSGQSGTKTTGIDCATAEKRRKVFASVIAFVFIFLAVPAQAFSLSDITAQVRDVSTFSEMGAKKSPNLHKGVWYQPGDYPYDLNMGGQYWRIGAEKPLTRSTALRLWYADLGSYSTQAYGTREEDGLIVGSGGMCKSGNPCASPDRFITEGNVKSVGLSLVGRHETRYARMFGELGVSVNQQTFQMTMVCLDQNNPFGCFDPWSHHERDVGLGYMVGFGAESGKFTFGAYFFDHSSTAWFKAREFPSSVDETYAIALGYRF